MSTESVTHDTDALLVQYAPQSQDVDVCISKMQDRIEKLERERDELKEIIIMAAAELQVWHEDLESGRPEKFDGHGSATYRCKALTSFLGQYIEWGYPPKWKSEVTE